MNNIDYLNKISSENQHEKSSDSLFSSKPLKFGLIAVAVLALFILIFGALSNSTGKEKSVFERLNLRLTNVNSSITTYNKSVKSSALRSSGVSLASILEATSLSLTPFYEKYELDAKKPSEKISAGETALLDSLNLELENGKLNGILDRTYAREMTYQISLLLSLEVELYEKTKDEALKAALESSYTNLETIYPNFNDFSETD